MHGDGEYVYCRLGNFHVKNNSCKKFPWCEIFVVCSICEIFLTVDGYNMDEHLERS